MRFKDQSVVVTGAGSGFGEAIAKRFAAEGAQLVLADINEQGLARVAQELTDLDQANVTVRCDVSQEADVEQMVKVGLERFGKIDVLVNNAGYSHLQKSLWKISVEEFDAVFAVNTRGVFLGCKHVIPSMIDAGGGCIVNIASIGALAPRPGVTPYNGTKGAVLTMTKGLALEVANKNIRVNAVNPVAADTGFMNTAMGTQGPLTDEWTERLTATIPRGRLTAPEDVAAAVTYLASADADFLTGTHINVDGGRSI